MIHYEHILQKVYKLIINHKKAETKYVAVFTTVASIFVATGVHAQDTWTHYTADTSGMPVNEVRAIAEAPDGALWVGTEGGGVARFDGETWQVFTEEDGLANNIVRALAFDQNGVLWCGTLRGLSRFDGTTWHSFPGNEKLSANIITCVAVDHDNKVWVGVYRQGVMVYDGVSWNSITTKEGIIDNTVGSIVFDNDDNAWVGTNEGLSVYDGMNWSQYTTENADIPCNAVFSLYRDKKGTMWVGTNDGISSYDGITWKTYSAVTSRNILQGRAVYSIAESADGTLWFGAPIGFWSFDDTGWRSYTRQESGITSELYTRAVIVTDEDKLFIGTKDALISPVSQSVPTRKSVPAQLQITIRGNYPNPFNPQTSIEFVTNSPGRAVLEVFSLTGQKVCTLLDNTIGQGIHTVVWNGKNQAGHNVASGVYFVKLTLDDTMTLSHRMMLVR